MIFFCTFSNDSKSLLHCWIFAESMVSHSLEPYDLQNSRYRHKIQEQTPFSNSYRQCLQCRINDIFERTQNLLETLNLVKKQGLYMYECTIYISYMDNRSVGNASIFFISYLKELFKKSLSLLRLLQRYYLHRQLSSFKKMINGKIITVSM